jgi:hypothetical protein
MAFLRCSEWDVRCHEVLDSLRWRTTFGPGQSIYNRIVPLKTDPVPVNSDLATARVHRLRMSREERRNRQSFRDSSRREMQLELELCVSLGYQVSLFHKPISGTSATRRLLKGPPLSEVATERRNHKRSHPDTAKSMPRKRFLIISAQPSRTVVLSSPAVTCLLA